MHVRENTNFPWQKPWQMPSDKANFKGTISGFKVLIFAPVREWNMPQNE